MCLGAGLTVRAPRACALPVPTSLWADDGMADPVNHKGCHNGTGHWRRPWSSGCCLLVGSWWLPLHDSLFRFLIGLDLWRRGWQKQMWIGLFYSLGHEAAFPLGASSWPLRACLPHLWSGGEECVGLAQRLLAAYLLWCLPVLLPASGLATSPWVPLPILYHLPTSL